MTADQPLTVSNARADIQSGYAALVTVMVIAVVVMTIGLTLPLSSVSEIQNALSAKKNEESLDFVESCVEDALLRFNKVDEALPGQIILPEGSCTVTMELHEGPTWTYTFTGTQNGHTKKVRVKMTKSSTVSIDRWEEF